MALHSMIFIKGLMLTFQFSLVKEGSLKLLFLVLLKYSLNNHEILMVHLISFKMNIFIYYYDDITKLN